MQKIPGWGSYRPFPPRESRGFTYFTSGRWPLAFEPSETFVSSSELRHSPKRSLWKNFLHAEVTYILLKRSAYCPRSPLSSRVWKAGLTAVPTSGEHVQFVHCTITMWRRVDLSWGWIDGGEGVEYNWNAQGCIYVRGVTFFFTEGGPLTVSHQKLCYS